MLVQDIQIREFNEEDLPSVYGLIQHTLETSYHGVYPEEAIEFFKDFHCKENILNDAATGYTIVVEYRDEVIGTGTLLGTKIRRVFVHPRYQHGGIGKLLMQELERKASLDKSVTLDLEASPVSVRFWKSVGYVTQSEDYIPVRNNQKLCYHKMLKKLDSSE